MASSGVGCSLGRLCRGRGVWVGAAFTVVCAITSARLVLGFRVDPLSVRGGRPGDCVIGCCTLCSGD